MYKDFWYVAAVISTALIYDIYLDTVGLCTRLGYGAANFTDVGILTNIKGCLSINICLFI